MDAAVVRGSRFDDESVGDIHIAIPCGLYCQVLAFMSADAKHGRVEEVVADAIGTFVRTFRRQVRRLPLMRPSGMLGGVGVEAGVEGRQMDAVVKIGATKQLTRRNRLPMFSEMVLMRIT
jgi:hypothetical protein